jgi:hypothetical protein
MANVIYIPYSPTTIEVDMAEQVRCIHLAPGEVVPYTFNWYHVLGADRILTSEWSVGPNVLPVIIQSSDFDLNGILTRVVLTVDPLWQGCDKETVTNVITTVAGYRYERCISVDVDACGGCGC